MSQNFADRNQSGIHFLFLTLSFLPAVIYLSGIKMFSDSCQIIKQEFSEGTHKSKQER